MTRIIRKYILNILKSNASALMIIKIDPYRKGSKVLINIELFNMKPINNIIDVSKKISELEKYIQNIINS